MVDPADERAEVPATMPDDRPADSAGAPPERTAESTGTQTAGGWWSGLRRMLFRNPAERDEHIQNQLFELDDAINQHPDAPMNYVLRGEYYLQIGYNQLAADDFRRGLTLAERELQEKTWGIVAQAAQDRARHGLKTAERRLKR